MPSGKRIITLAREQSEFVEDLVASGAYATEDDVIVAGLESLRDQKYPAIERWLKEEVLPVVERMEADPSRGIPAKEVFNAIRAHHERRIRDGHR